MGDKITGVQLAAYFTLVFCMAYSSTLKVYELRSIETSVDFI
jgi:hypothetical protein